MSQANRIPTTERLATALREANAPDYMIRKAREGYYDDFKSELAMPIGQLVADCKKHNLLDFAKRAQAGEFDAQQWEGNVWAESEEGRATFKEFGHLLPKQ